MTRNLFFIELQRLINSQPRPESYVFFSENCQYGNYIARSKDLTYCFDASQSSNSTYLFDSHMCVDCLDCDYCAECESCYECVDAYRCFNCEYLQKADNMRDSSFGYDLSNCHDVFGCVNLKNKSFCIFNRQFSEEEYIQTVAKYKTYPSEKILVVVEELKKRYPRTQSDGERNENTPYGNYVYENKNCYLCFDASRNQDSAYLYDSHDSKVCFDLSYSGKHNEYSYQLIDSYTVHNCNFIVGSANCTDSSYLFNCKGVKNSFGCVGLQYKQYCFLNRQLSKEEYEAKVAGLIGSLAGWESLKS